MADGRAVRLQALRFRLHMIDTKEIRRIARARLKDAKVLMSARRYDAAVYLCGYAVELGLKARICRTLKWKGYPFSSKEFRRYKSFRTHDLDVLLHLTGREQYIKTNFFADWSAVAKWNPKARYQPIGNTQKADAELTISACTTILKHL